MEFIVLHTSLADGCMVCFFRWRLYGFMLQDVEPGSSRENTVV